MITDSTIRSFRTLAACCSLGYLNEYRKAARYGEEDICDRNLWVYMLWAKGVMSRTPLMTEINGSIVVADAGTTAVNGTYYPSGTNAEGTVYTLTTDPYTYIHLDGGVWNLMYNDSPYYYQSSVGVAATPADATWSANFGASPVPTFTLLEVSGKCVSREFAEQVFDKAKCFCEVCGCTPAATPTPVDCTITPDYTVDLTIDAAQVAVTEADNQVDGFSYYITTIVGGSGSTPGQISTYSTTLGGWVSTNPPAGSIILDSNTGVYWVDYVFPVLPAQLFPPINSTSDGAGEYVIQSAYPWQSAGNSSNVVVEMFDGGLGWTEVYSGSASSLATPVTLNLAEPGYFEVRATYTVGSCTYQYFTGVITNIPNPPGSSRSWFMPAGFSVAATPDFVDCVNNQESTISFRFKIQEDTDSVWLEFGNGGWNLSIGAGGGFPYAGAGPTVFCYLQVDVYGTFTYVGDVEISVNEWHVVEFVRDATVIDGWVPGTDFEMYLDGVLQTMSPVGGVVPPSYIAGYAPTQPLLPLLWSDNLSGAWIDEVYGCRTARSQSDITNIIEPNLMQGSDATWDRAFYWRIEDTDNDLLVANQPTGTPFIGVTTTLSTDVDPSI